MTHDANCGLCARLARGETHLRNGDVLITPLCKKCSTHHMAGACAAPERKSLCSRCRMNTRAVEHVPHAMRVDRKRYADYCEPCMRDTGHVLVSPSEGITYWELQVVVKDDFEGDLFESLSGVASGRGYSR